MWKKSLIKILLKQMSVVLRVASSTQKIKVQEFHEFDLNTYQKLLRLFLWMDVNDSVLRLFHAAQYIEK